jgi:SAM-dependent methyltransferase
MAGTLFGDQGGFYDRFYETKNYDGECDFLEAAFRRYGDAPVKTVLDLGCGTGGHAIPLCRRGYDVTGIDISPTMLDQARRKADAAGCKITLDQGDVRDVNVGGVFDAVISMFAVAGYQTGDADLAAMFATARRHLSRRGLFVFDLWHGAAVLAQRPENRQREFPAADEKGDTLIRSVSSVLDQAQKVVELDISVRCISRRGEVTETKEHHTVRYLFAEEADALLTAGGFETLNICAFADMDREPTDRDWNMSVIARAV